MDKKLLIFDIDGTLADTDHIMDNIVFDTLRDSGIEIDSIAATVESLNTTGRVIIEPRALVPSEFAQMIDNEKYSADFWKNYDNHYLESVENLYDGIREVLADLKSRGYMLAALSNRKEKYVIGIINTAFGEGYFSAIRGWTDDNPKKPDPHGLNLILDELGVAPENAYMVGDIANDYRVAVNAGVNHVIVMWGYGKYDKIRELGATVFADKPSDLLEIIK